jgi:HD-like signal output (HDOD) protein/CheY-like chemotaxis protein
MTEGRVLFVDDESNLLSGLRRMLHAMRTGWTVSFAGSGAEALEIVGTGDVDVVVTDMRMPGMDGIALLSEVQRISPGTARMILSGQADQEQIIAAVGVTHQFLSKPCPGETLIDAVNRILAIRHLLTDPALHGLLGGVESLPKAPGIQHELTRVMADPDSGIRDLAAVIEKDPALSVDILKLVNSAYFGVATTIATVEQAAAMLGMETIHALAVAGKIFVSHADGPTAGDVEAVRSTAIESARLTKVIARVEGFDRPARNGVFLAAMLHDTGLLALAALSPDNYDRYRQLLTREHTTAERLALEIRSFAVTLAEVSAYLLALWGFPATVVDCLVQQSLDSPSRMGLPAAAVAFARLQTSNPAELASWQAAAVDQAGWADRLAAWQSACAAASTSMVRVC